MKFEMVDAYDEVFVPMNGVEAAVGAGNRALGWKVVAIPADGNCVSVSSGRGNADP